jgi:hypothetical protein
MHPALGADIVSAGSRVRLLRLYASQSVSGGCNLCPSLRITAGMGPGAPGGVNDVTTAWIDRPPLLRANFATSIAPGIGPMLLAAGGKLMVKVPVQSVYIVYVPVS